MIRQIHALFVGIEVAAVADVEIIAAEHSALCSASGSAKGLSAAGAHGLSLPVITFNGTEAGLFR
jgi:hypothetical protein